MREYLEQTTKTHVQKNMCMCFEKQRDDTQSKCALLCVCIRICLLNLVFVENENALLSTSQR